MKLIKTLGTKHLLFGTFIFYMIFGVLACQRTISKEVVANQLTVEELGQGWKLLFDGKTFNGWRGLGQQTVDKQHWRIEDGSIRKLNSGMVPTLPDGRPVAGSDLMTIRSYENYELYFEWKILEAGNSGLKYNVSEDLSQKYAENNAALGFEYQLLDDLDTLYAGKLKESQYTGSLYDMIATVNAQTKPVGQYNASRILIENNHVEHWLNGKMIVEYEFGSTSLDSLFFLSKYKDYPGFLDKKKAHIVLQNHSDDAWFRNIKIREINKESN